VALCEEVIYDLDNTGKVKERDARLRFRENLIFAFSVFGRVKGVSYTLPIGDSGGQALTRSIKVRDRLMHPKSPDDLSVKDDEVRDALTGLRWVWAHHLKLMREILAKVEAENDALRRAIEEQKSGGKLT
jgi:hypothetical protein